MSDQCAADSKRVNPPESTSCSRKLCSSGLSWTWVTLLVFVLDQASKYWVVGQLYVGEVRSWTSFFNLTLVYNPGAAWSFLADMGGTQRWFLVGFSAFASLALAVWLYTLRRSERWVSIAIALILGGALGNLYDRIMWGEVVDFLDFFWSNYHFPAFNVADSAITLGAGILLIDLLFAKKTG
ncbi:MAG: signal peptidase II [Gammaproteobacteria bacterium]